MAFKKAQPEQAAVKMAIYGMPGSGKTATTLLFAEGIANQTNKRIAFVDTERGTDFYAKDVPEREFHPKAWDFDAIYTRSITEILKECQSLKFNEYGVIVIDSVTHLWEAAIASYTGAKTKAGTIPMHAWGKIKAPYKALMHFLINSPFHVFILGRQGNEFVEDPDTGETKAAGVKMKAEGETPYEPHICARMESVKQLRDRSSNKLAAMDAIPTMFIEKDRSGLLQGQIIEWPNFKTVIAPLLKLLGTKQAEVPDTDAAAAIDADAFAKADVERLRISRETRENLENRLTFALTKADADAVTREITGEVKKRMTPTDIAALRHMYASTVAALDKAAATKIPAPSMNGTHHHHTNGSQMKTGQTTAGSHETDAAAIEAERKAMGIDDDKGEAWEPDSEAITQDTRDRINASLDVLQRQWNSKTREWAGKVIGRPIADAEGIDLLREFEGKKILLELLKWISKQAAQTAA